MSVRIRDRWKLFWNKNKCKKDKKRIEEMVFKPTSADGWHIDVTLAVPANNRMVAKEALLQELNKIKGIKIIELK